ncbi:MAG: hypothetical protein Fues2KO_49450 [Fuerstiella sp.]
MFQLRFTGSVVLSCLLSALQMDSVVAAEQLSFERDIRPIFRAHCFDCHGATEEVEGSLDLRLVRFLQQGGDSGAAIVPGQPDASLLLQRIRSGEMPPGEHRVPDDQIEILRKWIAEGAATLRPEPERIPPGLGITPEERSFWSFQPIKRPTVLPMESFDAADRVRNEIDALVLQSFPPRVTFAPDADRRTLIRRAYFDLIGLPPAPEELETWAQDTADDWYDRLLTELLDSPHYGERWARHWLDVAGYADSEGVTNTDADRPWAWKYRDWVIRSLNEDKPFDQFLTEQLAGDELAGPIEGDLTDEQIQLLTATGFLRMAADGTGSGANDEAARNQVMTDTLKIVGTSLLGLSIQCAQCHDHRYDPIPQTDYYALRAVFEPALDWKAWKVPSARRISLYTAADRAKAAEVEAETKTVADEKAKKLAQYMRQALDQELQKFAEPLRSQLRVAYETATAARTDEQKTLLAQHPSVNITPGNLYQYIPDSRPKLAEYDAKIAKIRANKPAEEFLRVLMEPAGHEPETKLFHRGDHEQPKQTVLPAALSVAVPEGQPVFFPQNDESRPTTGRRLAFAKWLSSRDNPLVARVIANRLWLHHFGQGLVSTPADFGKLGTEPSHPALLDWLADELMQQGWSLKSFHRMVLTSTTWRQQSVSDDPQSAAIPFARRRLVRLDAETIRDRMLAASGQLDRSLFGPPTAVKEDDTGQIVVDNQTRRSLYVKQRRSEPVAMLQAFDAPVMQTNCEVRPSSTVATQSLMLLNGEFILKQAAAVAERSIREASKVSSIEADLLPKIELPEPFWRFGYGSVNADSGKVSNFTDLPHYTGSAWQGGTELPDSKLGWVLLTAAGGHPGQTEFSPIRRWTAPESGTVTLTGEFSHASEHGDGVRARICLADSGTVAEWKVHNSKTATPTTVEVQAGETVDFVVDCLESVTSDSFSWPVTLQLKTADGSIASFVSQKDFRGPMVDSQELLARLVRSWQLTLCRNPEPDELRLAAEFFQRQVQLHQSQQNQLPDGVACDRQALTDLCHTLLSSNEFLYVE